MNVSLPWRPLGFALAALAVPACFSADDFSPCRTSLDCGPGGVCLDGRCASLNEGDLRRSDARDPNGGDGPPDVDHCPMDLRVLDEGSSLLLSQTIDCPNDTVTLRGFRLPVSDPSRPIALIIHARTIVVEGHVNANGAGYRGGGGGGGGGGGVAARASFERCGGLGGLSSRGGKNGDPGGCSDGKKGGWGGQGGNGGGPFSAPGGSGVDGDSASPGSDGYFVAPEPDPNDALATLCDRAMAQPGTGGGGGGGGRGADGTDCLSGGGGGGGGAGGPGGGLIELIAEEEIILRGIISAKGEGTLDLPMSSDGDEVRGTLATDGGAACGTMTEDICLVACEETDAEGGKGGPAGDSAQYGARGGDGDGDEQRRGSAGAAGGGGSGGFILLSAPKLTWEDGAKIDVRGSGQNNGGLVLLLGQSEGKRDGMVIGARYECPEMQFSAE